MKKQTFYFIAATMLAGTAACSSAETTTDETTATTETATDVTADADATTESDMVNVGDVDLADMANMDDPTFIVTAASTNMLEIQLGNMAVQNAADPQVKEYGQMMIDDHTMAQQKLQEIATELNVQLPETLTATHQALADKLTGKTGAEFNEDYMDVMETSHKMSIAMFEAKKENATNPSVQAYAAEMLPKLQGHHHKASEIEDTVD